MRVASANCQVLLVVPDAEEVPLEWPIGGAALVVAKSGEIFVSTICDMEGQVDIEVWKGELPYPHREPLYDGILAERDAGALVGRYTGDHLGLLDLLREGEHRVRVYMDPDGPYAERVYFPID